MLHKYLPPAYVGNVFVVPVCLSMCMCVSIYVHVSVCVCLFRVQLLNELIKKLHFWYGSTSWLYKGEISVSRSLGQVQGYT